MPGRNWFSFGVTICLAATLLCLPLDGAYRGEACGTGPCMNLLSLQQCCAGLLHSGRHNAMDLNGDGRVNVLDLQLQVARTLPSDSFPPPEPCETLKAVLDGSCSDELSLLFHLEPYEAPIPVDVCSVAVTSQDSAPPPRMDRCRFGIAPHAPPRVA